MKYPRPSHKLACQAGANKGNIKALMRSLVFGHPLLAYFIHISACILHGLNVDMPDSQRRARIEAPLYMQIDIGIEPANIDEMMRLCRHPKSYNFHSVEGMLQIYRLSMADPVSFMLPSAAAAAHAMRARMNAEGEQDIPLVLVAVVSSTEVCMQFPLGLPPGPMPHTNTHDVFLNQTVRDGTIASPRVADYIKYVVVFPSCAT